MMKYRMVTNQRRLFRGLFLINFLISLGFGIGDAFFPLYCQSIGARGLLLGVAVGSYALAKIIFSPLMGQLADRIGRRPLVLGSLLLYLMVSAIYLATESLAIVICLRLLQGISCAMFRPVVQAMIAEQAPKAHRASVLGRFDTSFYAALCIGPVIGGIIIDDWGYHGLFGALLFCSLTALGLALVIFRRDPTANTVGSEAKEKTAFRMLVRQGGNFPGLLLFIFGRACGITACATCLPILLSTKLGLSGIQVGIIMASATMVMTVLLRPFGKIADRVSHKRLVLCGGTVVALLYMLLPAAIDFSQVLGITLAIGTFSALSQPATNALLAEEGQRLGMGKSIGVFHGFMNLGFLAGALAGAVIQAALGLQAVFVSIGLIGLISLAGLALPQPLPFAGDVRQRNACVQKY